MEESIGNLILRVNSALSNYLNKHFASIGLDINTQQMVILMILWGQDGQRQQDLATRSNKDKTSVTRLLTSMEKKGLLYRKQDDEDSRQKLIYLTEKSDALKQKVLFMLRSDLDFIQNNIDGEELKICTKVLKEIHQNLTKTRFSEDITCTRAFLVSVFWSFPFFSGLFGFY